MTRSSDDRDIEFQLNALFDDPRMDVTPKAGAADVVVRGARRVRRRRQVAYAAGGVTAAAVVLAGGLTIGLSGNHTDDVASPSTTPLVTTTSAALPTSASTVVKSTAPTSSKPVEHTKTVTVDPTSAHRPPNQPQHHGNATQPPAKTTAAPTTTSGPEMTPMNGGALGPDGYKHLKMGMSRSEASATGMLVDPQDPGRTMLKEGTQSVDWVSFTNDQLACLNASSGGKTPESVGVGSSWGRVMKTYPGGKIDKDTSRGGRTFYTVQAGASTTYMFSVDGVNTSDDDKVLEFALQNGTDTVPKCYTAG